ncbi:MAG: type I-D CRISPR-associated protein Cas7/Csc2 [Halanaerobiales bacterium]|nr:type I-D CRISPR-associated protein Cas7/Csc2 [Halanaerobiales bacterium]
MTIKCPEGLETLKKYFVDAPEPILQAETIQILILREILDFTIFRTEDDREINTVVTPTSIENQESMNRVAFLASKQKAVESRNLASLLRTLSKKHNHKIEECFLKDQLCLQCPRCGLFGGTSTSSYKSSKSNIRHRISYSTAFSLKSFDDLNEGITFNAINNKTVSTGQALNIRKVVKPAAVFPSIITLRSATWKEFVLAIKTILSSHKYGAETRIGGDVRNNIVGIIGGWEELISPLEFTLELADLDIFDMKEAMQKVDSYKEYAAHPAEIQIIMGDPLNQILTELQNFELSKEFLEEAYMDIKKYREIQEG